MDKVFTLFEDLKTCYRLKVPTVNDFNNLNRNDKNNLCKKLRGEIITYLNSDESLFENHLKLLINGIKGNELFIILYFKIK